MVSELNSSGAETRIARLASAIGEPLMHRRSHADLWKGLAAGLAGGLVASWTMNQFQAGWSKASEKLRKRTPESRSQHQTQAQGESEGTTEKVAGAVASTVLHRELSKKEKKKLAPVVHYAFGTIMGGIYGLLAEVTPRTTTGFGAVFGTVLFAGVDEAGLAALGLANPPTAYPASTHAYALASHLVYGATAEGVRRGIRTIW